MSHEEIHGVIPSLKVKRTIESSAFLFDLCSFISGSFDSYVNVKQRLRLLVIVCFLGASLLHHMLLCLLHSYLYIRLNRQAIKD